MDATLTLPGPGDTDRFLKVMRAIIGPGIRNQTLIDLCCYHARASRQLEFRERVFVDVGDHRKEFDGLNFVQADVVAGEHPVFERRYDVSACLDGIEHIHKPQGAMLLERMALLAVKPILFTPLDPWMVEPHNEHPESHKCVWTPEELPGWAHVVFPMYHATLRSDMGKEGVGAFFFWKCPDVAADFERVRNELHRLGV